MRGVRECGRDKNEMINNEIKRLKMCVKEREREEESK